MKKKLTFGDYRIHVYFLKSQIKKQMLIHDTNDFIHVLANKTSYVYVMIKVHDKITTRVHISIYQILTALDFIIEYSRP